MTSTDATVTRELPDGLGLDFLWVELTNRCNLRCVHCYSDSHPGSGYRDVLTTEQYVSLMTQAYELGCRKIQLIGGEPQLHKDFGELLRATKRIGYDFVEVFSNLTKLDENTLRYAAEHGIRFATSVYSDDPAAHDAVTTVRGSHARTIGNLRRLIAAGVTTRIGLILIDPESDQAEVAVTRTRRYLLDLGVSEVRIGPLREFGRGEDLLERGPRMSGLCGHCWRGKLAIMPDGTASPCVMGRTWGVGNVLDTPLAKIVEGVALRDVRQAVYSEVWLPQMLVAGCTPSACSPEPGCHPHCPQGCGPDGCPETPCPPVLCPESCFPDQGCEPFPQ
jgi:pyruvate-formate lyase-activating enzyme